MTVVFDLIGVQNRDHGERGIARLVLSLALEVERQAPGLVERYLVRPDLPIPGTLEPLLSTGRVVRWTGDRSLIDVAAGGVFVAGSLFELQETVDRVLPRPFRDASWRRIAVLYDLIPLRFPELYFGSPVMRHTYRARVEAAKTMDHLLAISQATADDAVELLGHGPDRTTVIGAGADDRFCPHPDGLAAAVADMRERPVVAGLRDGYVMTQSGIEPRKNLDRLMAAYADLPAELRRSHQLVLQCKTTPREVAELRHTAQELGIVDEFLITGYVSDEDLVRLYRAADVVVFPSLYEGFGLPVLEAMQCGAPAICSDSSSLKEVQTDPAARFDPTDVADITKSLERVLTDAAERERIRSLDPPDFTWARAAEATIEAVRRLEARTAHIRPRRPRIALVTPLPPQASGIATYAGRMIEHLAPHAEVTAFVDAGGAGVAPIDGVSVYETHAFDSIDGAGRPFDRVLTFLGNSSFHVEALELIRRVGGTVLLHDARLTGLYGEVQRTHPGRLLDGSVGHEIARLYGGRYRQAVIDRMVVPPDMAVQSGIHLLADVVRSAHRVLVHSRYAADLTELDTGVRPEVAFPIPCIPPTGVDVEQPPALDPENHRIVSVGIVSPTKRPELLLDALVRVRQRIPDATLAFVGGVPDDYRAHLERRVASLGLADAVTVTGHVDDATFDLALADAACAVQLRAFTNGESSAAVMDALSAGTPTVVTALGAMTELPGDAVAAVAPSAGADELAGELVALLRDPRRRGRLRAGAHRYAAANTFENAAHRLLEVLGV